MRIADWIAGRVAEHGVDTCFMVTGGGAMHLNDAFGQERRIRKIFCHHEQAAAMAAEAYARIRGRPAVLNVTTGPGGINALNGVFGAYTDSIPMLVVSGQVKRETLMPLNEVPGLRQLGDQEVSIVDLATPITKWAHMVRSRDEIAEAVDKAYAIATTGRPGPAWIDVPIDIQGDTMPDAARTGLLETAAEGGDGPAPERLREVLEALRSARRPVILAGTGIRLAGAEETFLQVIQTLGIPVTTAWTHDIIPSDHALYAGRPGTIGTRAGNFVVQAADCLLILGSRLNIRQVSYNWKSFARNAKKIWVDIDPAELAKPFVRADIPIVADLGPFLRGLLEVARRDDWRPRHSRWVAWCKDVNARYSPKPSDYPAGPDAINAYHFIAELFEHLRGSDVVACGDATACIVPFQIGRIKAGMRMFSNSGSASMGYDLPAAVGAAVAAGSAARIICLAGDGSIMLNLQELQTIRTLGLDVIVFVLNNGGYLSIKQTQKNFFGRECGASINSGLGFPDFQQVGAAFGIPSMKLRGAGWKADLAHLMQQGGPLLCEVVLDQAQEFQPRLKSRMVGTVIQTPELEDMFPFLDKSELDAVRKSAAEI